MKKQNTRRGFTREVVNKNCHPEFISGSTPYRAEALNKDTFRAPLRSGFTLIELLVVVLIIGILAAVAVPQYRTAVRKAQFAKMRLMAETIAKGLSVYYVGNGAWPQMLSQLDIDLPAGLDFGNLKLSTGSGNGRCGENSEMYCCVSTPVSGVNLGAVTCGDRSYSFAYVVFYANHNGIPLWTRYCEEKHGAGINLCKTMPHARSFSNGVGMRTPIGSNIYDGVQF